MPIRSKRLDDITEVDLRDLVNSAAREDRTHEIEENE